MATVSNPTWLDTTMYPFESNYINLPAGKMYFVDEGMGEPILFVHGTPTWSFLYRNYIKELSANNRCIAPDHFGFGLSDKPTGFAGTPQAHSENLVHLVDSLGLDNITLIVHDFGGPIGLGFAIRKPEKIKRIVLFNTWLWETASNPEAQKVDKILNGPIGKFLYLNLNFSPKVLLKKAYHNKALLTKSVHRHYKKPFPNRQSRYGLLKIGQSLVGASDWYQEQWEQLDRIADKPFLVLWGMQDSFIKPEYLERWKARLPHAEVHAFDCGHFVQEEAPVESLHLIQAFLMRWGKRSNDSESSDH
jgi:haloalkane dehalogenase